MSFIESAVVLAWVALLLLGFGLAGLLRQVSLLTRQLQGGGNASAGAATGAATARTTRDLVGFRLPPEGPTAALVDPAAWRTLVAFVSPGCPSCTQTLQALSADPAVSGGQVALVAVSTGSCEPARAAMTGAPHGSCLPEGRDLLARLSVPATPYLVVLDGQGTLLDTLLPTQDTDLSAWLRGAPALSMTATRQEHP